MSEQPAARLLAVGNCGFDNGQLTQAVRPHFSASIDTASSIDEALTRLRAGSYALVLVNRLFNGSGEEGLELIRRVKSEPGLAATPIMLLSNYPEYQAAAVAAGAAPGFGKSDLGAPQFVERLRSVLG